MGRRARRGGIANAALRAARAAAVKRDDECAAIAQRVYNVAVALRGERGEPALPLAILAPAQSAAELAAPGAAQLAGLDSRDEELVGEVAAYLVSGFREMVVMLDPKHLQAWRERQDAAAAELVAADGGSSE